MTHDIPQRTLLTNWRRHVFSWFIGASAVVGIALMIIGPVTVAQDNRSLVGIAVVAFELIAVIGGIVWMTLLVTSKRRRVQDRRSPRLVGHTS